MSEINATLKSRKDLSTNIKKKMNQVIKSLFSGSINAIESYITNFLCSPFSCFQFVTLMVFRN